MKETPKSAERELKKVQIGKVINDKISTRMPFLMLGLDLPPPPLFRDVMEKNITPQVKDTLQANVPSCRASSRCTRLWSAQAAGRANIIICDTGGPVPSCSWPWGTSFRSH